METPEVDLTDQVAVNYVLLDRSARLEHAIFGNGQPGLVQRVASIEGWRDEARAAGAKAGRKNGMVVTATFAIISIVAKVLGIPLPGI